MVLTTLDLLRHGELEGGVKYRGRTDDPLTAKGRADMDAVWARLCGKVEVIVTSPLGRCRIPAEDWALAADIPCLVEDDFIEMDYGEWEGLTPAEIEARYPGMLEQWRHNPEGMRIPGAEELEDFAERVTAGLTRLLAECAGRHVLLVAHSGTLRLLLAHATGGTINSMRRFAMPYAGWSRIQHESGFLYLEFLNRQP